MLVLENLVKNYKYFNAVENISLSIGNGQIYGIAGPIGSGKSTLLKIAAGVLMPCSGKVEFNGINIYKNPGKVKKSIGYMPERIGFYDELKVYEYMNFYTGIYGIPKSERSKIIDQLLELTDLSNKKNDYVEALSQSRKKWLCLARGLIHNPELIVLDEPQSGLDPKDWSEMTEILITLKDMGKSILLSSNSLPGLAKLSTYIGLMEHGKLIASGSLDEITKITLKTKIVI